MLIKVSNLKNLTKPNIRKENIYTHIIHTYIHTYTHIHTRTYIFIYIHIRIYIYAIKHES